MSIFYQPFLRKGISSLTLAVEMVKKSFLSCGNHITPLETVHLVSILRFDVKHKGKSDMNFLESVLFKEAWYPAGLEYSILKHTIGMSSLITWHLPF